MSALQVAGVAYGVVGILSPFVYELAGWDQWFTDCGPFPIIGWPIAIASVAGKAARKGLIARAERKRLAEAERRKWLEAEIK